MSTRSTTSSLMRLLAWLGLHSLAWSARRLHCPVSSTALVLEVGSGGKPYARADVLFDAYEETRERHWEPLIKDRPLVLGFVERLPFKDKTFDFVIASHVLEHSPHPELFISELERVAKAGYIEVPDALMERINPYRDHRLEIEERAGCLVIRKKKTWCIDEELVELYEKQAKKIIAGKTIPRYPFDFHIRFFWDGKINYRVVNPEVDATWPAPIRSDFRKPSISIRASIGRSLIRAHRVLRSCLLGRKFLSLQSVLACTMCRGSDLVMGSKEILCRSCGSRYKVDNGAPLMHPLN